MRAILFLAAAALAACTQAVTPAAVSASGQPSPSADEIVAISLERRCFGCPGERKVTLRRDGVAERTTFGNARRGTEDERFAGTIAPAAFQARAAVLVREPFFSLRDEYADPRLADGEWKSIEAHTAATKKTVLDRNGAAPPAVQRIAEAIEAAEKEIAWKPVR